jgi:hypothetical protein
VLPRGDFRQKENLFKAIKIRAKTKDCLFKSIKTTKASIYLNYENRNLFKQPKR